MRRFLHLFRYIKLLKKNKKVLADSRINNNPNPLGIQYDWIYRLYTVLNLPFEDKDDEERYGFQNKKNELYIDNMVRTHIIQMNNFLFELGILEYVDLDIKNIKQIDDNNIRIVLKFKYINVKFLARLIVIGIPILFIIGILYFIL